MAWFNLGGFSFANIIDDLAAHGVRDAIKAALKGAAKETAKVVVDKAADGDDLDWNLLINNDKFLPIENRRILIAAIARLPREEQDDAERLIGKVLSQGKNGFFKTRPITTTKRTEKPRKGMGPEIIEEPVTRDAYPEGYEPEVLTVAFLRDSTKTAEAADIMLSLLLQKSRNQRVVDQAKKLAAEAADKTKTFAKAYVIAALALFVITVVSLVRFINSPGPVVLITGLVSAALFTLSFNIFRAIVPGRS